MAAFLHTCRDARRNQPLPYSAGAMTQSQLSDGIGAAFAMVPLEPQGPLLLALTHGRLQPRDLAALWLLLANLDWRSGRCWLNTADLAAAMGHRRAHSMQQSLGRLRKEGLVARGSDKRDPRRRFWCINPAVAATGGKHRRAMQWQQFERALE
jgi:hypothetical protein